MTTQLALTVVCDNLAAPGLAAEHGWSLWLETAQWNCLFDCGSGETLMANAEHLGVPLAACQQLVLSHGHYDHSGGMARLMPSPAFRLWLHPDALLERFSRHPHQAVRAIGMPSLAADMLGTLVPKQINWLDGPQWLTPSLAISGAIPRLDPLEDVGGPFFVDEAGTRPDCLNDDLALWLATPAGLVVVLGCCHAGLINTVSHARQVSGIQRLAGVIGGLHLSRASQQRIDHSLAFLRECQPDFLWLGHCTGQTVIDQCRAALAATDVQSTFAGARYQLALAGA